MNKNKFKNIAGFSLIEMLISLVISTVMMAAMYTTYNIVNKTYSQVSDRAKISSAGRDIVEMLMRDIRMAGFKYYRGTNTEGVPTSDYLTFNTGKKYNADTELYERISLNDSHDPLIIIKDHLGLGETRMTKHNTGDPDATPPEPGDLCCDKIIIVYGDYNQLHTAEPIRQPYKRYRITYFAEPIFETSSGIADPRYAVFKKHECWIQKMDEVGGAWSTTASASCPGHFDREKIRDHVVDMEFIPFNQDGRIITPAPRPDNDSAVDLYNIRSVDIRLTFRSHKDYFNKADPDRLVIGLNRSQVFPDDKYLRDSVVVTVHTRNIGSGI
tara:strand:- start:37 stop:1017 length:981 start_codon:yes stop_codon:yes gene_type:complete